jgi:hypothetical protein
MNLAEFVLTAHGFDGFVGNRGEHAVKLRGELSSAVATLLRHLGNMLEQADRYIRSAAQPIPNRLHGEDWRGNRWLWAMVPLAADRWVQVNKMTAEQVAVSLGFLRATLAEWQSRRPQADDVARRLRDAVPMPAAAEFAEAVHTAETLAFTAMKLDMLYRAVMHSMPVWRLWPSTAETEALAMWWPWPWDSPPMVRGKPPKPPKSGNAALDLTTITATQPQHVVREVMERTGMDRTTAQRLTLSMRLRMRQERREQAAQMLRQGKNKADVARAVGLSPSRISALFKGKRLPAVQEIEPLLG